MYVWLAAFIGSRGTKVVFGNFSLLTLRVSLVLIINLPYVVFWGLDGGVQYLFWGLD